MTSTSLLQNLQQPDGVLFTMQSGVLRVQVWSSAIVRVGYSPTSSFPDRPDYVVTKTSWSPVAWTIQSSEPGV